MGYDSVDELVLKGITKHFGRFTALDRVDMQVQEGSIHAVLGENGAGKTTLMNILSGLYQPDDGSIILKGKPIAIASPAAATAHGIGMVHQHLNLVDTLTATENVILGLPQRRLNLAKHTARLAKMCQSYGFEVDLKAEVWRMPMGMRQRVEILKVLYRNADILILDEPTSILTPTETASLLTIMRDLARSGHTIMFISHKLDEVMTAANRVTVLRQGQVVADQETAATDAATLASLMVGRELPKVAAVPAVPLRSGAIALEAEQLCAVNDRGLVALNQISFILQSGEILGIAGVDGNGQAELAEVLTGLRPLKSGCIRVHGQDIADMSVAERYRQLGIAYVPGDRQRVGLVMDLPISENAILRDYARPPIAGQWGLLNFAAMRERASQLVKQHDVRLHRFDTPMRLLSGGNQQKLLMGREMNGCPTLLIAEQPCKGLDIGAIATVQNALLAQRAMGTAILYISTELEQLLQVADRIAVMYRGHISGILLRPEATRERVGLLMAGQPLGANAL
jgi:simple sugar transport system ATP-binding protein